MQHVVVALLDKLYSTCRITRQAESMRALRFGFQIETNKQAILLAIDKMSVKTDAKAVTKINVLESTQIWDLKSFCV